jgi:hypothetical protein
VSSGSEPRLPDREGSSVATCLVALDPTSLIGMASASLRVQQLRILSPYHEGSSAASACPTAPCGSWDSSIKKSLVDLPTQLGSPVPNACAHVPKVTGVRAIMDLQDVRTGNAVKTCKTCG